MGIYGRCEQCGNPIEPERLAVLAIRTYAVNAPNAGVRLILLKIAETPGHVPAFCVGG